MSRPNTLELAADLGEQMGGGFGRMVFEECQIAALLMMSKQPYYTTGLPGQRVRENLIFVAPPAWGKSYQVKLFIDKCLGAVSYSESNERLNDIIYAQLDGASITTESVRGGCTTDGRPIVPLALKVHLFFCSDLPTFLGGPEQRGKALNMLLNLAEEGEQEVIQLKFSELKDKAAAHFEEACKEIAGMSYIAGPPRGYKFHAKVPFIFCTTPLTMRGSKSSLEASAPGVLSRFTIREWAPTDKEVREIWLSTPSHVMLEPLRICNYSIWRTPFFTLPFPPRRPLPRRPPLDFQRD